MNRSTELALGVLADAPRLRQFLATILARIAGVEQQPDLSAPRRLFDTSAGGRVGSPAACPVATVLAKGVQSI